MLLRRAVGAPEKLSSLKNEGLVIVPLREPPEKALIAFEKMTSDLYKFN